MNLYIWPNVVKSIDPKLRDRMQERRAGKTISKEEFDLFCKEFVFEKIKGVSFGTAFCKRFGIEDSAISILKTDDFAKELIKSLGYIKE